MHYFERNITPDFDSSKSFRKVDVYKTLEIAPFLAYRIQSKIYDTRKNRFRIAWKQHLARGKLPLPGKQDRGSRNICNEGQPKT